MNLRFATLVAFAFACKASDKGESEEREVDLGEPAPELILPDLSDVDLNGIWLEALEATFAVRGTTIWDGTRRALERRHTGCPSLYVGAPEEADVDADDDARADGISWSDFCETDGGLYYRGYQWWDSRMEAQGDPTTTSGRVANASRTLMSNGVVGDPNRVYNELRGTVEDTLYRVDAGDYRRWSWTSSVVGTTTGEDVWEPVASPLAGGLRADLYLAAEGGDANRWEARGDLYLFERRIGDRFDSVSLNVSMVGELSAGPDECTLEPRGWIGLRDSNAWWLDVVFQPPTDDDLAEVNPDDPYTACDGCGTLYLRGLEQTIELGTACADFSSLWADPLLEPAEPESFVFVVRDPAVDAP